MLNWVTAQVDTDTDKLEDKIIKIEIMENKIVEFVREFNGKLVDLEQYNQLEYVTDGFYKAVRLPTVGVSDYELPSEHHRKIALSHLLKLVSDWGEVAGNMFSDEIWAWEKEVNKQLEQKFTTSAKMRVGRLGTLRYNLIISGKYCEESMDDFLSDIKRDFEYMFDGCKLDYKC